MEWDRKESVIVVLVVVVVVVVVLVVVVVVVVVMRVEELDCTRRLAMTNTYLL